MADKQYNNKQLTISKGDGRLLVKPLSMLLTEVIFCIKMQNSVYAV